MSSGHDSSAEGHRVVVLSLTVEQADGGRGGSQYSAPCHSYEEVSDEGWTRVTVNSYPASVDWPQWLVSPEMESR